jgi:hypothetical protein
MANRRRLLNGTDFLATEAMATERDIPQPATMSRSDDLVSKLYREIGISALAATAHKPQKSMRNRRDIPAVPRDD